MRLDEQLRNYGRDLEGRQAPVSVDEILHAGPGRFSPGMAVVAPASRRRWIAGVAAGVIALGGLGLIALVGGDGQSPDGPSDSPVPEPVATTTTEMAATTSSEPVATSSVPQGTAGGDHRSYFSVEDAVEYLDPDGTLDELPASRAELAEVLAGGETLEGTNADFRPNLFFVLDPDDQGTVDRTQELFSPRRSSQCAYNVGGLVGMGDGVGYPPGLTGAFQAAGDGGSLRPDWVYVHWYDDDLTYDDATALFDESVLGWILSRWNVGGRGYSGSKIAVTLSPDPTAPWNQAVIDHPFIHPAAVEDNVVEAVCDTFAPIEAL